MSTDSVGAVLATRQELAIERASDLFERTRQAADEGFAMNTRRVYALGWRDFVSFCATLPEVDGEHPSPLPAMPQVVAMFVTSLLADRGLSISSVTQRLAAIKQQHEAAGYDSPTIHRDVTTTLRGFRRTMAKAGRKPQGKRALALSELERITDALTRSEGASAVRDRALVALGFLGAFRRSELAGLDLADVRRDDRGFTIELRTSKTDQLGTAELVKAFPRILGRTYCPVAALEAWLAIRGEGTGPLFQSMGKGDRMIGGRLDGKDVARILRRRAEAAGVDVTGLGGHSLRIGFVTAARERGAATHEIQRQSGHKTSAMVDHYTRHSDAWTGNAAMRF